MTHKRLIAVAVIVAAVIVLSVVAVITVVIDDFRNPPDSHARASRRCRSGRYALAS
ncbi:hypothetical protein [Glycomyces rhizosphaerae]|uniref:Uncharacterized protein n=1 Tax=Glycomyces rhizosphaerae TaxID=2054422 RepID=A0ABV7PXQ3_9ACTN